MKRRTRRQSTVLTLSLLILALAMFGLASTASAEPGDDQGRRGRQLTTQLSGAEEVSCTGELNAGDPAGTGRAVLVLNAGQGTICYTLEVANIAPATAAHIHFGDAGDNGPVVVGLQPPTDGSSSGCATADRELIVNILRDPDAYYVNVHNLEYPGGAVRGQLGD